MKTYIRLVCLALCLCMLGACVKIDMPDPEPQTVYASFYPIYALAGGVCRGVPNLSLYCLAQPQDGCIRSYTLSDWDAALLAGADLLILGGRGLESFEGAFGSGSIPVLTAMDNMPLIGADETADDEDSHFAGPNPWYFLSVSGARNIAGVIAGGMAELDPDFAGLYAENLAQMHAQFDSLEAQYSALFAGIDLPGAILMQEGLCYFAEDAGLTRYIEIEREAGTDMSDNELSEALGAMEESGYRLVLIERQAPQGLVQAIEAAGYTVVPIDILTDHSASEPSETYFSAMLSNAQALAAAVQQKNKAGNAGS